MDPVLGLAFIFSLLAVIYVFHKRWFQAFFKFVAQQQQISDDEEREELLSSLEATHIRGKGLELNDISWSNELCLILNGEKVILKNPDPADLLVTFLREQRGLKGTKVGCEEGGCGACTVVLESENKVISANSCLRLLVANDGISITTVEGLGSVSTGLSIEQQAIVDNNGSQCGFCTPGWVTAMHALRLAANNEGAALDSSTIDGYFDGNICRCTGYRPIMQAFQSLCGDSKTSMTHCKVNCPPLQSGSCKDIEDSRGICENAPSAPTSSILLHKAPRKATKRQDCSKSTSVESPQPLFFSNSSGKKYYRPVTLPQLCAVLRSEGYESTQLLGGNTSIGVTKYLNNSDPYYAPDSYKVIVDLNKISELSGYVYNNLTNTITFGATLPLSELISLLNQYASKSGAIWDNIPSTSSLVDHSSSFSVVANHLRKVANTQVRNAASWAGNLMMFLKYKEFPSDVVIALTTANATLQVAAYDGFVVDMSMAEFLAMTLEDFQQSGRFIVSIQIKDTPIVDSILEKTVSSTFKIAQREHNAHAYVNAGFSFKLTRSRRTDFLSPGPPLCSKARVVFGGISTSIFIATSVEDVLNNAYLDSATLYKAMTAIEQELAIRGYNYKYAENPNFLLYSAQSCLYQAILRCYSPTGLPSYLLSALLPWNKRSSHGVEFFPITKSKDPVGKPIKKLESKAQCTGEAEYPSDITDGLFGAILYSSRACCTFNGIDKDSILSIPGVIAVITADDISGENKLSTGITMLLKVGDIIPTVGTALAIIVSSEEATAKRAVAQAQVFYSNYLRTPIVSITDAIASQSYFLDIPKSIARISAGDASSALSSSPFREKGSFSAGGQYHFYMENHCAHARLEDGQTMRITCGTQDPTTYQSQIAQVLGLSMNKVVVECSRTGGGFGGKLTGGLLVSSAAALCAYKLKKPVRIFNSRTADMNLNGGREEWMGDYDVGFDSNGVVQGLQYHFYVNAGVSCKDTVGSAYMGMVWADNAYYFPNYLADIKLCRTDTPPRTYARSPGVVQTNLATEIVLERVANRLGLPVKTVQERNFITDGKPTINGQIITDSTLSTVWDKVVSRSMYDSRVQLIDKFNSESLWRKKGIAITPVKYGMGWAGYNAGVRLGVSTSDGTVMVSHSGIEIGQGINTKVAQAVASALGIDISLVCIEKSSSSSIVNGGATGGSTTSETVVQAALNACSALNLRLDPFRSSNGQRNTDSGKRDSWTSLIQSVPCDVSLNVEGWYSPVENPNQQLFQYFVYGACVTEVELNVLTGQVHILACELVYDCGTSLNPAVDIGQIEGALVMSMGYFFNETVRYESGTGMVKSVGTWDYKPPLAQDIPTVLNVTLLSNAYNKNGILGSKAVGEPPYIVSNSAYFACKNAIAASRRDANNGKSDYFSLDLPATIEKRFMASLVTPSRFILPY